VRVVQRARDRELENAVSEELEPFVRQRAIGRPGRMGEDALRPPFRERLDQPSKRLDVPVCGAATGAR
jgi:hypothetical protein